ncbi:MULTISPECIES: GNAT family N-acetyltransferase [Rhizobium]|uniref:GNAT family N-acetyltransferase n=1 Tax=Rhizobium TaxID=379 RepID=UPI00234FA9B9|nr:MULTISPECIES: GNAT family N-acetyltransferase [unclassified Rhizobium]MDC7744811.1 GNAT family N-acetyltransferase [Rhizobium sp. BC56]MDC9811598.1 GNAT family N-acetyltransferase [Rhizobium sp. MC62]MDC9835264.1 GNAT family N-acetyltransferase [Rhizobium sp. MJ37]WEA24921.1 GNAT family N-acetyltransferase [Rhizobium sp. MJ22]WEA59440.1 GNAT family N-acetyltransferase [Rhizobium sp. BJ04]
MDDPPTEAEIVALSSDHMQAAAAIRRVALWQRLPWLPDLHTPWEDEQYWRMHLLPNCTILGAAMGNRLIGVIAYGDNWIEQLYILPDFQGMGIGSRLLGCAKEEMDEIRLWTFQRNIGARAFYERHGFAATEETDGVDNEEREPDVLYHWRRLAELTPVLQPSSG